ncbi:uncharacterized protein [Solanum lycopersicum]|uniref:uncharacterized protein isoform X2 n=1 Tax=Solanum lycopersicum TaxID=4081 RepID=UPI000E1D904C|nr:uncharacterized protein LOC101266789 isoform X2 [Solanum lycopersicum]
MDSAEEDEAFIPASVFFSQPPPNLVSLSPFTSSVSPSPRRLSSCYSQPSQPIKAKRELAWVSLQGRLIGAEEASSSRKIGGGLNPKEAVAWELFSPIHRILIVAVVAIAAANSKKNKQICRLKKSVELRDQVLLGMQQKLDTLCEQVNYFKDQPETAADAYDYFLCEQHFNQSNNFFERDMIKGEEILKFEMPPAANQVEPEERRMSDLSDWATSVASSVDIQKECEEKDVTIRELSTFLQSSEAFGAKRIGELEDIIRRKNKIITKLKKDVLILEQKVINLTRLRRPSFSSKSSKGVKLPSLTDNILYDMDSSSSPSSSDSDSSPGRIAQPLFASEDISVYHGENTLRENQKQEQVESLPLLVKPTARHPKSRPVSPLKEKSLNQLQDSVSRLKPKQASSISAESRRRRPPVAKSKDVVAQKRWL